MTKESFILYYFLNCFLNSLQATFTTEQTRHFSHQLLLNQQSAQTNQLQQQQTSQLNNILKFNNNKQQTATAVTGVAISNTCNNSFYFNF